MPSKKEYLRDKEGSQIGKIIVDRDLCIAAASCIAMATDIFALDDENKAVAIDPNASDDDTLISAAESCPTKAILLFDKEGNQIYPK